MKRLTIILATLILVTSASVAFSQSLVELAKKEKERREQIKAQGKVITNQDASKFKSGAVTTLPIPAESAPQKATSDKEPPVKPADQEAKSAKPASDEPTDFQGRSETFWRQSLADARKKIKDLENEGNVIVLKIASLQNQFYRESDGFKQQTFSRDLSKAFYEQDLNKEKQITAKADLDDLLREARKSGALPGWLDEKPSRP